MCNLINTHTQTHKTDSVCVCVQQAPPARDENMVEVAQVCTSDSDSRCCLCAVKGYQVGGEGIRNRLHPRGASGIPCRPTQTFNVYVLFLLHRFFHMAETLIASAAGVSQTIIAEVARLLKQWRHLYTTLSLVKSSLALTELMTNGAQGSRGSNMDLPRIRSQSS